LSFIDGNLVTANRCERPGAKAPEHVRDAPDAKAKDQKTHQDLRGPAFGRSPEDIKH
jgi:hypothetical protein